MTIKIDSDIPIPLNHRLVRAPWYLNDKKYVEIGTELIELDKFSNPNAVATYLVNTNNDIGGNSKTQKIRRIGEKIRKFIKQKTL